ncbi:FadR family transcriptional regulator, partial [Staphylococcus pseudintermedius]
MEEHSVILEAIKNKDSVASANLMTAHLAEIRQTLVENYIVNEH